MAISWTVERDALTVFSFVGFVLSYIPLIWHFKSWNIGCLLWIFWVGTQCLSQFINHIVWRDNAINHAPIFCEISTRFQWMAEMGIVSAGLVIARRLCIITTSTSVHSGTRHQRRRAMLADLTIGLAPPLAQLVIYWFVQGHRFDIFEGYGCTRAVPNTWLAILLSVCWPIPIGLVSAYYSVRTLLGFRKRSKEFGALLASNYNLSQNRYLRLMIMAWIDILFTLPLSLYVTIYSSLHIGYKYVGLADLHFGFDRIRQYPYLAWKFIPGRQSQFSSEEWTFVAAALVFFLLFGVAEEARKHYTMFYFTVSKRLGFSSYSSLTSFFNSSGSRTANSGRDSLPSFVRRNPKHDTLDSLDRLTAISVGDFDLEKRLSGTDSSIGSLTRPSSLVEDEEEQQEKDLPRLPQIVVPERQAPSVQLPSSVRSSNIDMV